MLIAMTGSGKSALLNSMINYLCKVDIKTPFRYNLNGDSCISSDEDLIKTSEIKSYYIKDHGRNIKMRIIDTPEWIDTRGLEYDQRISKAIKDYLIKDYVD